MTKGAVLPKSYDLCLPSVSKLQSANIQNIPRASSCLPWRFLQYCRSQWKSLPFMVSMTCQLLFPIQMLRMARSDALLAIGGKQNDIHPGNFYNSASMLREQGYSFSDSTSKSKAVPNI